jgi:hypothetical protein
MEIRNVDTQIHQLMDENYRLFFNIKPPEVEMEEDDDERKIFGGEEGEFELLEKEPVGEVETDEEIEEMPSIGKAEEHISAKSGLVTDTLRETRSDPFTVSVTSARHTSIPKIVELVSKVEFKPDAESESELALFLQSLRQTEEIEDGDEMEIKCGDEIESVVCTEWLRIYTLEQHTLFI